VSYHYLCIRIYIWGLCCTGNIYGGACSTARHGFIYVYTYTYIYILKYGGPPADGGHPGGRRTGGRYTADGNICLRYGGREDTEGAPAWRQGRRINIAGRSGDFVFFPKAKLFNEKILLCACVLPIKIRTFPTAMRKPQKRNLLKVPYW
jgi:hypothetical protein